MKLKQACLLFLIPFSSESFAFQCYLTLVKDSCWTNYEVKLNVLNAASNKLLTSVSAAKGKSWARQAFDCEPGTKLIYQASFQPIFWESDKGKSYMAIHYWTLPDQIGAKESAWDIPVCFPSAFAGVPFPPHAAGDCRCDFLDIPSISPVKVKAE
ncbi:MAG: hypothetical protein H0U70_03990 [Tatlockia sp.]|nr:hypothetical protein [Tatlockia sp.]